MQLVGVFRRSVGASAYGKTRDEIEHTEEQIMRLRSLHAQGRLRPIVLMGTCVCLALSYLVVRAPRVLGETTLSFTADYVDVSSDPQSGLAKQLNRFYAQRADGAIVRGRYGPGFSRRELFFPAQKLQVSVADSESAKTTYDYSGRVGQVTRRPHRTECRPASSQAFEVLGRERVLGYDAYGYKTTDQLTDGMTLEVQRWLSPALGCFEMHSIAYLRDAHGNTRGVDERTVVRVTPGEPEASLFSVPRQYGEVHPAELEEKLLRGAITGERGRDAAARFVVPECLRQTLAVLEKRYAEAGAVKQSR